MRTVRLPVFLCKNLQFCHFLLQFINVWGNFVSTKIKAYEKIYNFLIVRIGSN